MILKFKFKLIAVLLNFLVYVNGLLLKINDEIIFQRSIKTRSLESGIKYFLQLSQYEDLAQLLRVSGITGMESIYSKVMQERTRIHSHSHLNIIFNFYKNGFLSHEDSKTLLPVRVVNDFVVWSELTCEDIKKLPSNPLSFETFVPSQMNVEALNCAILRGFYEKDPMVFWSIRPLQIPLTYDLIWTQPEIWRVFIMQRFCNANIQLKRKFLQVIKSALDGIVFKTSTATASINDLIMINVSLFDFYLDISRRRIHLQNVEIQNPNFKDFADIQLEILFLFSQIELLKNQLKSQEMEIFDNLNLETAIIVAKGSKYLNQNPFYYYERIELFEKIIQNLKKVPIIFADWFCNLYFVFDDVIPKMSFDLFMSSWRVFIANEASIEAICNMLKFLQEKIPEHNRLLLAKEIPASLIPEFYKRCPIKNIPEPLSLIPYEIRKADYLKKNRGGTREEYIYDIKAHWRPNLLPMIKIINIFEQIASNEMEIDLFETVDMQFSLGGRFDIGLSRFLEILLETFLKIKEWYVPLDTEIIPTIIPSVLFPPEFMPILVKLLLRCRLMSCKNAFKLSKKFLGLTIRADRNVLFNASEDLERLTNEHLRYLQHSSVSNLPRLSRGYRFYWSQVLSKEFEFLSDHQSFFIIKHFHLRKIIISLWENKNNNNTEELNLELIKQNIKTILRIGINMFGEELGRQNLLGSKTFSGDELHRFLFN